MRAPCFALFAWFALAAATPSGGAAEIPPEVEVQAKAHFDAATRAFDEGDYDAAVKDFLDAWRLHPLPSVLINIAVCYERTYKADKAREYYELFLAASPDKSDLRTLADKRLKVLRQLPGSVLVDANKPGAQVLLTGAGIVAGDGTSGASAGMPSGAAGTPSGSGETPPGTAGTPSGASGTSGAALGTPSGASGTSRADIGTPSGASGTSSGTAAAPSGPVALGTQHRFEGLPPGDYHVHVSLPDHVPVDENIHLAPGQSYAVPATLVHQREQLTLFSIPDGARVFLDDHEEGVTPFSRTIETGRGLRLRLEASDYLPYKETLDLEAGRPVYRRILLPRPRRSGRTELALGAMVWGGFAASAMTVAIGGNSVTTGTGITVLGLTGVAGVGLGLLGAWALTDDAMKVGHSSIILGATIWGATAGASLAFGLGLTALKNQQGTQQDTLAVTLLGSGLGLGAGIVTAWLNDTSPGDAAIVNSGGLWGTAFGALLTESINLRRADHDRAFGFLTLGATSLGVLSGAVMARFFEVSRGHVAIVDAAGVLGMVLGYGIGFAAGEGLPDPDSGNICPFGVSRCVAGARYAIGGMVAGLLAASILTRKYKDDLPRMEALFSRHGESWALGLPQLRLGMRRVPSGFDTHAVVDLFKGEW